jgi:Spy/CpxP family protein refolding chaperone
MNRSLDNNNTKDSAVELKAPKINKRKSLVTGTILAAIIFTITAAASYAFNWFNDDPYGLLIDKVASEINLNEQQKSEVTKIKNDMNAKLVNRKVTHVTAGKDIESLFRNDTFDKSEASRIANMQDKENQDLAVYMVDELEKLHGLLTSQQRNDAVDKIKTLYAQFKSFK